MVTFGEKPFLYEKWVCNQKRLQIGPGKPFGDLFGAKSKLFHLELKKSNPFNPCQKFELLKAGAKRRPKKWSAKRDFLAKSEKRFRA